MNHFADAVSRLSDSGVALDTVERILLAIERAGWSQPDNKCCSQGQHMRFFSPTRF